MKVTGWDERGNPLDADGRSVEHRNLSHAYASTARKVQGSAATRVITGFDRHSVKAATRDVPYVINSRGREFCEIYVESIADLAQIQNRSGDRKTVTEMGVEMENLPTDIRELAEQMRVLTDCPELLEHRVVQPAERKSALDLINRAMKNLLVPARPSMQHAIRQAREQQRSVGMER